MASDWTQEANGENEVWTQFRQAVIEDMVPKLLDSTVMFSLVPSNTGDVKFWVELGAAIMYDKPIVALVRPGQTIAPKLRKVADRVIECDLETDEGRQRLSETLALIADDGP